MYPCYQSGDIDRQMHGASQNLHLAGFLVNVRPATSVATKLSQ